MPGMKTVHLVQWFGTKEKIARFVGITPSAVSMWGEYPPPLHQLLFEHVTESRLRAEPDVWQCLFPRVIHPTVRTRRGRLSATTEKRREAKRLPPPIHDLSRTGPVAVAGAV